MTPCTNCGKPLDGGVCPDCGEISRLNLLPSLPLVSFVFVLFLLMGFSFTRFAVQSYRVKQRSIAVFWMAQGAQDVQALKTEAAIDDYENALAYDRENNGTRLQLTSALTQAGRYAEAQSHLRGLWEERPGDSNVNLQLARLEARQGNLASAERYYEGAIYGVWPANLDPYQERLQVRVEFTRLLISAKRREQAMGQLEALSTESAVSGPQRKELGDLFMQAGAPRQAFMQYMQARSHVKGPAKGYELELAQAAFAQNDFAMANRWATAAVREDPSSTAAAEFAKTTASIVASDPYETGITELARAQRVIHAFASADARMGQCFPSYAPGAHGRENVASGAPVTPPAVLPANTLSQVANFSSWAVQLRPQMVASRLRHRDDVEENAMRFVFQAEQYASKNCSLPLSADDSALVSLAKERWSNE